MLQNVRKSSCLLQNISFGMRIFVIRTYTRYPYCYSDMSTETYSKVDVLWILSKFGLGK